MQEFTERVAEESLHELDVWDLDTEAVAGDLAEAVREGVTISAAVPPWETAIFEGAQGVLLDEYRGFHPHTTWSTPDPVSTLHTLRRSAFGCCSAAVSRSAT